MTSMMNWVSPSAMQSLGWALLHFLWQGTALAALAAGAMALCSRASQRYLVGLAVLGLMLLAPLATFFYGHQRSGEVAIAKSSRIAMAESATISNRTVARSSAQPFLIARSIPLAPSLDALPWLVVAWLLGVAFFSLRCAGGLLRLERERRRQSSVVSVRVLQICSTLQDRIGLNRAVDFCECKWLQAPAVIGWFRPVVFLPVTALTGLSEEQLEAVIAHELAHIQRFDPFVNVFQVCVETLLFYHPAIWWLNKKIRAEREHCCDETAVAVCGNAVEYARALALMEEWRSAPVLAMAANRGPLSERVLHLLGLHSSRAGMRKVGFAGSIVFLATALVAGNALFGIAYPKPIYANTASIRHILHSALPQAQPQQPAATPAAKPSAAQTPRPDAKPMSAQSYIDGMKSAGLDDLSADSLIALKVQDVTPEYVRGMHELGLHPDADTLVGMKVQGVTPEYVKGLRSLGFNPDADEIIGMKVQGVTPEYVQGLKEAGISADADQIVGMKVQGVTPEYVRELQALGLKVDADDVVGLKVQGVTPEYVKGLRDQGLNPDSNDVIGMRVQSVTPEYIRDIRALGLNPSAEELIGMKVQGVNADYIKTLQSGGFKPDVDEVIGAKVQGITPEFIDAARKHGFKDLTIDKLIQLKNLGI